MNKTLFALLSSGAAALLVPAASAQSFNIDVADGMGVPADAYAAAASQPGHWNSLIGGPPYAYTINDLSGNPTAVTTNVVAVGNGLGDFFWDNANTFGDDEKLMDDLQDVGNGSVPSETTWTFSGLSAGNYSVYVYAWAPDNATYVSHVSEGVCGSGGVVVVVGGPWPGGHVEGVTYALLDVAVVGGTLDICVTSGGIANNFGGVNGFQFVEGGAPPGSAICFGDGGGTSCPCGNNGGGGCANSTGAGSTLIGAGSNSVSAGDLALSASNALPGQPGLFFQGDNAINGGNGNVFGDGLRCCGGNVIRLQVVVPDANGNAATSVNIAASGGVSPGDTKCYQYWYRDPAGPCGSGFNLTNGYQVSWGA